MPAWTRRWPSAISALGIVFLAGSLATAQYDRPTRLPDTGIAASAEAAPAVSPATYVPGEDLASRVAELEASLKKMQAADAAAKKKAAEKPTVIVGGRLQIDSAMFSQDAQNKIDLGNDQNGVVIRRAWFDLRGTAFDVFDYKWQWSIEPDGKLKPRDNYISVNELPYLGHVRVGHFKEPFGLERLMSPLDITFMERFIGEFFTPDRHLGVMTFDWAEDENATWAIGAFTTASGSLVQNDRLSTSMTMRGTWLPWYDEATEGRGLLHTGVAYSYRDAWEHKYFGEIKPAECYLDNKYSATVTNVDHVNLLGTELAWVYGPLSMQSEYMISLIRGNEIDGEATDEYNPQTFYAYVSYFLTGEHRPYERATGIFGRVKPFENFFRVRDADGYVQTGKGAWEVGYRWSWLDLNDATIEMGAWSNHTFGLNWYLTPYMRLMFNYVRSTVNPTFHPGHLDSSVDVFEMRTQVSF